jgi:hypothetical protein
MTTTYAQLGSVSSGTMQPKDLIPAFLDVLHGLDKEEHDRMVEEYGDALDRDWADEGNPTDEDSLHYCLEELFDALNEHAPPYASFGAHEGDGADYGFWIDWDLLNDDCDNEEVLKLDAGDDWPDELPEGVNYVLEVNDHGNATLYSAANHTEIWSVV